MSDSISTVVEDSGWVTTKTGVAAAIGAAVVGLVWWACSRKQQPTICRTPAPTPATPAAPAPTPAATN